MFGFWDVYYLLFDVCELPRAYCLLYIVPDNFMRANERASERGNDE